MSGCLCVFLYVEVELVAEDLSSFVAMICYCFSISRIRLHVLLRRGCVFIYTLQETY